jgi:hypothetical protein
MVRWAGYFEQQDERPFRHPGPADHQLALVAQEVNRLWQAVRHLLGDPKDGYKGQLKDFLVQFTFPDGTGPAATPKKEEPPSEEEKQRRLALSKMFWQSVTRAGKQTKVGKKKAGKNKGRKRALGAKKGRK